MGLPSLSLAAAVISVVGFPFLSTYAGPPSTMLTTSAAPPVAIPAGSPFADVQPARSAAASARTGNNASLDVRPRAFDIGSPFPSSSRGILSMHHVRSHLY